MKKIYLFPLVFPLLLLSARAFAGNPDRQGEAGAGQLLINPWARSAGLHGMNTASVTGADAMYLNVSGLARIRKTQITLSHTVYLAGADMGLNSLSFAQHVGKGGAFGITLVSMDLGDFDYTTEDVPEGTGATFSPSYFNMGVSYAHRFENKVSVGATVKFVNESLSNVGARAVALDAGVQYVSGEQDNFKFGIALRNVGSRMHFTGEGLTSTRPNPNDGAVPYPITYYQRSTAYELPSQLNIGLSYDWVFGGSNRLSAMANFTSNAFSRDQVGGGLEFTMGENFALRVGYKSELSASSLEKTLDNGVSGGFSVGLPVRKGSDTRISLDYAYRTTSIFDGIHNIGLRLDF
ncbi:MAG: PorV/PorQ family protein [Saprospiraceae bacterium]